MTRRALAVSGVALVLAACLIVPLWLSFGQRERQVRADRAACRRSGENFANDVNQLRTNIDLADTMLPPRPTAVQRSAFDRAVANDRRSIAEKEQKIDYRLAELLQDPQDRASVSRRPTFDCRVAFPKTTVLP